MSVRREPAPGVRRYRSGADWNEAEMAKREETRSLYSRWHSPMYGRLLNIAIWINK